MRSASLRLVHEDRELAAPLGSLLHDRSIVTCHKGHGSTAIFRAIITTWQNLAMIDGRVAVTQMRYSGDRGRDKPTEVPFVPNGVGWMKDTLRAILPPAHWAICVGRDMTDINTSETSRRHGTNVEVLLTGVGGQGIQLLSRTLALAAVAEGHQAMMLGNYGGTIRGGPDRGDCRRRPGSASSLPIIPSAWAGIVMSPLFWEATRARSSSGGPVVVNSCCFPRIG